MQRLKWFARHAREIERITNYLRKGAGASMRKLQRITDLGYSEVQTILDRLVLEGHLKVVKKPWRGSGNRHQRKYYYYNEEE